MTREEQLKQAIEPTDLVQLVNDVHAFLEEIEPYIKDAEAENFSDPSVGIFKDQKLTSAYEQLQELIKRTDPEIIKQAGWVRENEWISVEDRLPEENKIVTVKYYKHKKGNWSGNTGIFITQAYYVARDHFNFDGNFLYRSKEWYDYTDRLIWDANSQSKNKVISWTTLTI